jgi:mono/diheme cytochrome c family protein
MNPVWARFRAALTVGVSVLLLNPEQGRGEGPKAKELQRGLIATFTDPARHQQLLSLEPAVALALEDNEAPHPRLASEEFAAEWTGYVNIRPKGSYRFAVRLRGDFRLTVAGREVLKARSDDKQPRLIEGPDVQLNAGAHSFVATFKKARGGDARIELLWQGPGFRQEPLPFNVLGHLSGEAPAALATQTLTEQGRFLFEEASCVRCHVADEKDRIGSALKWRQGPDLSKIGARAHAGWIERWLESPQKVRPGALMPNMFGHDEMGRIERFAVARYLSGLGGPVKANDKQPERQQAAASFLRGQKLFNTIGCLACHQTSGKALDSGPFYGARANFPLPGLGSKTTPERLAEYLKEPLALDPSGRMPHMLLDGGEALDLARFLCQSTDDTIKRDQGGAPDRGQMIAAFKQVERRAEELAVFEKLPPAAAWTDLGKRLVIARGCNSCHTIEPGGQPFAQVQANADLSDLKKLNSAVTGCLADKPDPKSKAPRFAFSDQERAALRAFLKEGVNGAGSPAPAYAARADLRRFNCLACHSRDGEGGLTPEMIDVLGQDDKTASAEAVSPPPLTGTAHKLRTPWARQVLTGAGRARPWMSLRMPQFGAAQVGQLPEALAALEGTDADNTIHKVPLDAKKTEAGRLLVGKTALGCVSCHDIAGVVTGGTRGPDLALMNQRVRYDWYVRWLEQAPRMQPGTRMPEIFSNGKSLFDKVYDGDARLQAEAIWAYLSLGPELPLPLGVERPGR